MSPYVYLLPLIIAISLVYSASRHESWSRIWGHAVRVCLMILIIMGLSMAILLYINARIL